MIITIDWFDLVGLVILAVMLVSSIVVHVCALIYEWHDKHKKKK